MKKLIVGLAVAGLLLAPLSVVRAQVTEPVDQQAIMAQLQVIYAQLVQILTQLQAQLAAQIAEQSNQIVTLQNQNSNNSKKIDQIVTNTTPAVATPPPVSEPTSTPVVQKELKIWWEKNPITLDSAGGHLIVQVLHDGQPTIGVPFTISSTDLDERGWNALSSRHFVTDNGTDGRLVNGPAGDYSYGFVNPGTYTFTANADGMTQSIDIAVIRN